MKLNPRYFDPFDRVYADVTTCMQVEAKRLAQPDQAWLDQLIKTFQQKRNEWNSCQDLNGYRERWSKLRSRIIHLAAGAYLHVAYDLPRCIADDWPGQKTWNAGPSELRGQRIYSEIRNVFPDSLRRAARNYGAVGYASIFMRYLTPNMLAALNQWLLHLRLGAWEHARVLATQPDRSGREAAMAKALTAALEDVSDLRPWTYARLGPPDTIFYSPFMVTILAVAPYVWNVIEILLLLFGAAVLLELRDRGAYRTLAMTEFIWEFGLRVQDYMAAAVQNPEGLDAFLRERRSRDGLAPPSQT